MNLRISALLMISLAMMTSCASYSPIQSAERTFSDYQKACAKNNPEKAAQYLLRPNSRLNPCPDNFPDAAITAELTADRHNTRLSTQDGKWKIYLDERLTPNSPQLLLYQLKYALKNQDVDRLISLIPPSSRHSRDDLNTWIKSSKANELYAAIAAHPNPWFQLENDHAICEVAGITIHFQVEDDHWYIMTERMI
ncbi:MAG: hypothetical protein IJM59_13565 [Proteobacteria bacterium]|nr:hypothetical protein [Pseudomonadota bacterium]